MIHVYMCIIIYEQVLSKKKINQKDNERNILKIHLTMIKTTNTGTLALVHVWQTCNQF